MQNNAKFRTKKRGFADLLNYAAVVDEGIILCKDGSLMASWIFRGADNESASNSELNNVTLNVNKAFSKFGSGWMLHTDEIRVPSPPYSSLSNSSFDDPVTRAIEIERKEYFDKAGNSFESNFVLTITFKPPLLAEAKFLDLMIDDGQKKTKEIKKKIGKNSQVKLRHEKILSYFKSAISDFQETIKHHIRLRPLRALRYIDDYDNEHVNEEILSFVNRCITGLNYPVNLPPVPMYLDSIIGAQDVWAGTTPKVGDMYMIPIAINGFPSESYPSISSFLSTIDVEFRWNTRYIFIDQHEAEASLNKYRRKWKQKVRGLWDQVFQTSNGQVDDDASNMVGQVNNAINDVKSGLVSYGYYTSNIILMGSDLELLELRAKDISTWINAQGFSSRIETVNAFEAFLGSLPGHSQENVRRPLMNTLNLAHLLPLSSIWPGEQFAPNPKLPENSPPLMQVKTNGSEPFRLNLHVSDVGHALILGPTGAGKSTLLGLIKAQAKRYKNSRIYDFDVGRSGFALNRAVGGTYFDIGSDEGGLHFAPLASIDPNSRADIAWFSSWVETCLRLQNVKVSPEQKKAIYQAVLDCLSSGSLTLTDFKTSLQDESLKSAMEPYTISGAMGDLLDAEDDNLSLSSFTTFEIAKLMEMDEQYSLPTLLYLFWRIEKSLDGSLTFLVLDEAWLMLASDAFKAKIKAWLKTLRKANCSVIMATQSISDAVNSGIMDVLKESCSTIIYLPNDKAVDSDISPIYKSMGLNDREIKMISQKIKKKDYYFTSSLGKRWFDLALGELTLSFIAASDPKDIEEIRVLEGAHGNNWTRFWLENKGISSDKIAN